VITHEEERVFIGVDFSQIELRVIAWETQHWGCPEQNMFDIYLNDKDIHITTGCATAGITEDNFFTLPDIERKLLRQRAKAVNFGQVYGCMAKTLKNYAKVSYGVDMTIEEAETFRNIYFNDLYPRLLDWHRLKIKAAYKDGYIIGLNGQKRNLPGLKSMDKWVRMEWERKTINSTVQGFAGTFVLMALILLKEDRERHGIDWIKPCMTIHDSVYISVPKSRMLEAGGIIKYYLEDGCYHYLEKYYKLIPPIPIKVDLSYGDNFAKMKEEKDTTVKFIKYKPSWASFEESKLWIT
jgi:DNA polymerase I-like protein with 3'-5' exonuclease and polymerase domains